MKPSDKKIHNAIKKMFFKASPELDNDIWDETLRTHNEFHAKEIESGNQNFWRIIMKSKLTNAAAIILAVLLVIHYSGGSIDGSSVVWGNVIKKLEDIHTYSFIRLETTNSQTNTETKTETKVYYSTEYGELTESFQNGHIHTKTYSLLKEKVFIGIIPLAKRYEQHSLSDAGIKQLEQMMPRQIVMRFLEADYNAIGSEVIDGVKVEKVEIHDYKVLNPKPLPIENFTALLYVDVKTELPVYLELEFTVEGKTHTKTIFDQFQWNIELDSNNFKPNIPDDYKLEKN
jgi:outer membrane lipoprotein-sorting protein